MKKTILTFAMLAVFAGASPTILAEESYSFHDGAGIRKIYIVPDLVADFGTGEKDSPLSSKNARLLTKTSGMRVWQPNDRSFVQLLKKGNLSKANTGKLSPVFSDWPGGKGMRALPGGVIVVFHDGWGAKQVSSWAKDRDIRILKRIISNGNIYLVSSPAGLPCLSRAAEIQRMEGVKSATPNWWTRLTLR